MIQKILTSFAIAGTVGVLLSISACNTVAGAGTDIEKAGDAIHNKAKEEQKEN